MRGASRAVLARGLAADLSGASCKDLTTEWAGWERAYSQAATVAERHAAAEPALSRCNNCPATAGCAQLAELGVYTGLAGAAAYRNGRRQLPRHPPPAEDMP